MKIKLSMLFLVLVSFILSGQKKDELLKTTYSEYGIIETKTYKNPSTRLFEDDSKVDKEIRFYNKDGFVCLIAFLDKNDELIRLKNGYLLTKSWECTDHNKDPVFISDTYPINFVNRFNSFKGATIKDAFQATIGFYYERRDFIEVPHIREFLRQNDSIWLQSELDYLKHQDEADDEDEVIMHFPKACGAPRLYEYHYKKLKKQLLKKVSFSNKQLKRMHHQLLVSIKVYKNGNILDIELVTKLNRRQQKKIEKNVNQIIKTFELLYPGSARCQSFSIKGALRFDIE